MLDPIFVLDADVFIRAKNSYYAFDLAPRFWELLVDLAKQNRICSIDRVKNDLLRGKDKLAEWATSEFAFAFASTYEDDVLSSYARVMNWAVAEPHFSAAAKSEFANERNSDGWLVAYAVAKRYHVVTNELPRPDIKRRVPIPNVCAAFNIQFVDTFEMLRQLRVRLG